MNTTKLSAANLELDTHASPVEGCDEALRLGHGAAEPASSVVWMLFGAVLGGR